MRLPKYVTYSNDENAVELLNRKKKYSKTGPRVFENWHLLVGQVLFGIFYRGLILGAIPWDSIVMYNIIFPLIIPLGTAFGTYMVSNLGLQKSPFSLSLIGAYAGECLVYFLPYSNSILAAGVSMIFSTYGWGWREEQEKKSNGTVMLAIFLAYVVFVGLTSSFICYNASIEGNDGEKLNFLMLFRNFLMKVLM